MTRVVELFGTRTDASGVDWHEVADTQICPFDHQKCYKTRKSESDVSIGTCTVLYRRPAEPIMICPKRLVDQGRIFRDVLHLLTWHEPGNDFHLIPEFSVPGGSIDFVVASAKGGRVVDFVGVELQTLDTTGTVWPERQRFLIDEGVIPNEVLSSRSYGMNWKMTAKTILMQMHHKAETFSNVERHLVLVVQDALLEYMDKAFDFSHFHDPVEKRDPVHFHAYAMDDVPGAARYGLSLAKRLSTDVAGIERSLGLKESASVEEADLLEALTKKLSRRTLFDPISREVPEAAVADLFDHPEPEDV